MWFTIKIHHHDNRYLQRELKKFKIDVPIQNIYKDGFRNLIYEFTAPEDFRESIYNMSKLAVFEGKHDTGCMPAMEFCAVNGIYYEVFHVDGECDCAVVPLDTKGNPIPHLLKDAKQYFKAKGRVQKAFEEP